MRVTPLIRPARSAKMPLSELPLCTLQVVKPLSTSITHFIKRRQHEALSVHQWWLGELRIADDCQGKPYRRRPTYPRGLKRVHNPDALYELCRLANDRTESAGEISFCGFRLTEALKALTKLIA